MNFQEEKIAKAAEKLAKEQAKKEAKEAKERAKREAIAAEEKAIKEAEEARKAKKEEKKAKKESEEISITATNETVMKNKANKIIHKLYEGEVKILILPPIDSKDLKALEGGLRHTKSLRILLTGGTADGGVQMVVSASKPVPILNTLKEMSQVEEAISKDDTIYVSLK